jgi:hypothetical protein
MSGGLCCNEFGFALEDHSRLFRYQFSDSYLPHPWTGVSCETLGILCGSERCCPNLRPAYPSVPSLRRNYGSDDLHWPSSRDFTRISQVCEPTHAPLLDVHFIANYHVLHSQRRRTLGCSGAVCLARGNRIARFRCPDDDGCSYGRIGGKHDATLFCSASAGNCRYWNASHAGIHALNLLDRPAGFRDFSAMVKVVALPSRSTAFTTRVCRSTMKAFPIWAKGRRNGFLKIDTGTTKCYFLDPGFSIHKSAFWVAVN